MPRRLLVLVVLCGFLHLSRSITVRFNCMPSKIPGREFQFTARIRKDGDNSITGITAVDADVNPTTVTTPTASSCTTSTEESPGIYALTADIDTQSLTCGVTSGKGTVYNIQVRASGTRKYYTFSCDTAKLFPSSVSQTNFATKGITGVLHHIENPFGVKAQVLDADGNGVPARSVKLGQDIKLRVIYDIGHIETGPTNMGMVFHTGFIRHTGSNLFLRLFTPRLGTNVHITGVLAGKTIDQWVAVRRESPVKVTIPTDYQNTGAKESSWTKELRGLKIESRDSRIGVILGAEQTNDASELTVFPDDILGTVYRPFTSTEKNVDDDQEVLVIGTKTLTTVTITYNIYKIDNLRVDGKKVGNGAKKTEVMLKENELLHIFCDTSCDELEISSTEKIAVISGWEDQGHAARPSKEGHSSTQVIPTAYYSDKYVAAGTNSEYIILNDDPTDDKLSITTSTDNNQDVGSPHYEDNSIGTTEVEYSKPVAMYKHSTGTGNITPGLSQLPSIAQWGTSYFLTLKDGAEYNVVIVTAKGHFGDITLNGRSMTSYGHSPKDVQNLSTSGATVKYEFGTFSMQRSDIGKSVAHFKSGDQSIPFLLEINRRVAGDNLLTSFLPFGVRYPKTNPVNEDNDGETDEDITLNSITASFRGIYVKTLLVADNAAFTGATTVHTDGCNVITPNTKAMASIKPFEKNTNLATDFSDYWVIDTESFNAFKYFDEDEVYFRILFDFCVADLALCENSCKTSVGKRKRSVKEDDKFIDLMIQVTGNETDVHVIGSDMNDVINAAEDKGNEASVHPCTNNAVLWVPVSLLLMTIFFESTMTVYFSYKRFTLMKRLKK